MVLVVLQELPLLWMLIIAVRPDGDFLAFNGHFGAQAITGDHFRELLLLTPFLQWCTNTIIVSSASALLASTSGCLFAFALRFARRPHYKQLKNLVLVAYLLPSSFLVLPILWLISSLSPSAPLFLLPLVYQLFLFPICVWIASSYVDRIPSGIIAMARLENLGMSAALRLVFRPFANQALWAGFAVAFVFAMQEYVYAFFLTSTAGWSTLPVGIASLQAGDVYQWSLIASAGVGCTILVLILLLIGRRLLRGGLNEAIDLMARKSR